MPSSRHTPLLKLALSDPFASDRKGSKASVGLQQPVSPTEQRRGSTASDRKGSDATLSPSDVRRGSTFSQRKGSDNTLTSPSDGRRGSTLSQRKGSDNSLSANDSRRASTTSQRKGSDPPASQDDARRSSSAASDDPPWLAAMKERNKSVSSDKSDRKDSVGGSLKGLFGRRKSKDATTEKPKEVIYSKHAGAVRNVLKADPRGARRHSTGTVQEPANKENLQRPTGGFVTAKEQEERHPHSGPPVLDGMPMLTTIMSRVEESDDASSSVRSRPNSRPNSRPPTLRGAQGVIPEGTQADDDSSPEPRRKSVHDVQFKQGPKAKKMVAWGGWHRDSVGNWTKK